MLEHNAPIAPGGRTSSAFCTHTTWTSTMFVKKSIKLHSVAGQILKKKVFVAFYQVSIIHPKKNITVRFTIFQWDSLTTMRNDLRFWTNICQVNTASLGIWKCTLYYIFHYMSILFGYTWKYYKQFSAGLYTWLSQLSSDFYHGLFVPTSVYR